MILLLKDNRAGVSSILLNDTPAFYLFILSFKLNLSPYLKLPLLHSPASRCRGEWSVHASDGRALP